MFVFKLANKANDAIYDIESEKHDFESPTRKLVWQLRNAYTKVHYLIKKFKHENRGVNLKVEA